MHATGTARPPQYEPKGLTIQPYEPNVSFAIHKTLEDFPTEPRDREKKWIEMLTRALARGTVVAFIGSGCSRAFGLPDWKGLAAKIAEAAGTNLPRKTNASDIPSLIGHYKLTMDRRWGEDRYKQVLKEVLEPGQLAAPNPYEALLELRIHRFITSNYDHLLEDALQRKKPRNFDPERNSFGPKLANLAKLAEFVIADPASHRDMVFHCHGRTDDGVDSLIVNEEEYQEQYFGQGEERVAFRQALELLYGSNPILFIGTSLDDEDLFRPLRSFGAIHRARRAEQLLFALISEKDQHRIESLYRRYGVKAITYDLQDPHSGIDLNTALKQLHEHWMNHRESWLRKPLLRQIPKPAGYVHRHPGQEILIDGKNCAPEPAGQSGAIADPDLTAAIKLLDNDATRVLCLLGPGGSGKSRLANRIIDHKEKSASANAKLFFWSSYYSGDYLSGLDRALAFLGDSPAQSPAVPLPGSQSSIAGGSLAEMRGATEPESRLERLLRCLNGHHVLIFDGVERVLRESPTKSETGIPLNPDIARFLKAICQKHNSKIILTSRLWPETLDDPALSGVECFRLSGATPEEIRSGNWLPCLKALDKDCGEIVRLLGGHRYALTLAEAWLDSQKTSFRGAGKVESLRAAERKLRLLLAGAAPEHRVSRMIELVVQDLNPLEQRLLDNLAVCMGTIPEVVEGKCRELAKGEPDTLSSSANAHAGTPRSAGAHSDPSETLRQRSLLFRMRECDGATSAKNGAQKKKEQVVASIHPIVRGYVFHRRHHAGSDELPNFTLPGFTAGGNQVDPGGLESANEIIKMLKEFYGQRTSKNALDFCRNAFGIIRSRMDSNTSARWDRDPDGVRYGYPGERYLRTVIQLGDFVRQLSPPQSSGDEPARRDENAPLWDDELAWLYNEIGLAYYHKGAVLDALSVWELEHEINSLIDSSSSGGLYLFQSSCNLAAAFIQLGRLQQAEAYLRHAERINARMHDMDHGARITGYRGLLEHLRGNMRSAQDFYKTAIRSLRDLGYNQRGLSVFERHYADLLMRQRRVDDAERYIITGRARAEAARYPDIVANYRISDGHLHRIRGKIEIAMSRYTAALEEAREMGLRGLEADALSELSRLALDLGDTQTAIDRAVEALQIANELCLGIRQTHGLVVLGRALIGSKRVALGAAYLRQAKKRAELQGYWLRAREADEELRELGSEFSRAR